MANTIKDTAVRLYDGLSNMLTGMGGSLDPSKSSFYTPPMLSQHQIDNSYRTSWLSAAVHDIPAIDATRNWRRWVAEPADITALENEEKRLGLRMKFCKAETWSRLYGGSVLMLGVRNDNPAEPLDVNTVKKGDLKYVHVISRYQISAPSIILDPGDPHYGEPAVYQINAGGSQYIAVDPSRVVRFLPKDMPEHIALQNGGWGDPTLYLINQSIMDADTSQSSFSAIVAKSKTDTVEIPNLIELASTQAGEDKLKQRIQLMKAFEGLFSVRILAGAKNSNEVGEKWSQWQAAFTGMPDMQNMFWQAVSGASGIPTTRLIGMSPAGLNATGQADESNYFQLVSARQEMNMRPRMEILDEILIRSATGARNPETSFAFNPLAIENQNEKATTAGLRATAFKTLSESNTVPSEVLMKMAKAQIIDSGEYPGSEDAYKEYEAAGGDFEPVEAPAAANDNPVLAAATEGLAAQGKSASVAARDAIALCDSTPRPLYVSRMVLNRDELQAWATEQGLGELQPDLHVTITYSTAPVDWLTMENSWSDRDNDGSGNLLVTAGGPRLVEPLGNQTAVLMFSNTDLQWRNEEMRRKGCSWDWQDYTPHVSLTKVDVDLSDVQPYRGRILLGPELFQVLDGDMGDPE